MKETVILWWQKVKTFSPLITENKKIPDNSLVMGSPGKIIRQVTEEEIKAVFDNAVRYQNNWKKYLNLLSLGNQK